MTAVFAASSRPTRVDERVREHERNDLGDGIPCEAHREAVEDRPLAEAERAQHLHVRLAGDVEHACPHHACDHAGRIRGDRASRQHEMRKRASEHRPVPVQYGVDHREVRIRVHRVLLELIIIPPVSARYWTHSFKTMMWLSALFGGGAGSNGYYY